MDVFLGVLHLLCMTACRLVINQVGVWYAKGRIMERRWRLISFCAIAMKVVVRTSHRTPLSVVGQAGP